MMRHYINGTSLTPLLYANPGGAQPGGTTGANQIAEITADLTSINGATSIDQAGTALTQHGLIYPGGLNVTDTSKDISRLTRVKFPAFGGTGSVNFFGGCGNNQTTSIELLFNSGGGIV